LLIESAVVVEFSIINQQSSINIFFLTLKEIHV